VTALATPFHTSYLYDDYSTSFFDGRHNVIAVSHAVNCRLPGSGFYGATENARPENAGLENDGQHFSKLWAKLRGLENAGLENDGPC